MATENASYFHHDLFYETFKDTKYPLSLIGVITVFDLISLVGAIGNFTIAYATFRSKNLHNSCNYLLAICALADFSYEVTHATPMIVLLSGATFIRLRLCFYLSVVPLLGLNIAVITMFFIAADRLMAVTYPVWHRGLNPKLYVSVLFAVALVYASCMLYFPYVFTEQNYDWASICLLGECFQDWVGDIYFKSMALSNVATVGCYGYIRWKLRKHDASNAATRKMFKSLAIIVAIICVGWFASAVVYLGSQQFFNLTQVQSWFIRAGAGIPINTASALSAFVLFTCSKDYHGAIVDMYAPLFNCPRVGQWWTGGTTTVTEATHTNRISAIAQSAPAFVNTGRQVLAPIRAGQPAPRALTVSQPNRRQSQIVPERW